MCGIVGISSAVPGQDLRPVVQKMMDSIVHRGPDGQGIWRDDQVTLGHLRLAIRDLSPQGAQPMVSPCQRYVMVYNGEIYNVEALKKLLPPDLSFRGHSDTEVILAAITYLGIEVTLSALRGMFAIALYDCQDKLLHLIRDPMGIKPLYYGFSQDHLIFASQVTAFHQVPFFDPQIEDKALSLYLKYNYIPAPYSIYKACYKQQPGTILTFSGKNLLKTTAYWSLGSSFQEGKAHPIATFEEACDLVEQALQESVHHQLVADVPVGVFLSGGIDSSLISYFAQQKLGNLKTFSIGFEEKAFDEAPFAKQVAKALGTTHYEHYLNLSEILEILPKIPEFCDEPFGDASQVPTFLVSQLAKKEVSVALSGDGGDELFFGYGRYRDSQRLRRAQKYLGRLPLCLARVASTLPFVKNDLAYKVFISKRLLLHSEIDRQYDALFNFWPELTSKSMSNDPSVAPVLLPHMGDLEYMAYHDSLFYLPDDILVKTDRCSMIHSLETRVPFLDHPFVNLAHRIPMTFKYKARNLKSILKTILKKHIPPALVDRPKKGFALPVDQLLRSSLKDWAFSLMDDLKRDGLLDYTIVQRYMDRHQKLTLNYQYSLWNILMWQQWKNNFDKSMGRRT
jgi:asparagine synthase (glutamine-hydrolysing)